VTQPTIHWGKVPIGDSVTNEEAKLLRKENHELRKQIAELQRQIDQRMETARERHPPKITAKAKKGAETPAPTDALAAYRAGSEQWADPHDQFFHTMYERLVARLLRDPEVIRLSLTRPVIQVEVATPTLALDGSSLKGRVALLISKDFFATTRRHSEIKRELERTGTSVHSSNLSNTLNDLVKLGFLTYESPAGYLGVPEMKVHVRRNP
jgi:hypothetical protein